MHPHYQFSSFHYRDQTRRVYIDTCLIPKLIDFATADSRTTRALAARTNLSLNVHQFTAQHELQVNYCLPHFERSFLVKLLTAVFVK